MSSSNIRLQYCYFFIGMRVFDFIGLSENKVSTLWPDNVKLITGIIEGILQGKEGKCVTLLHADSIPNTEDGPQCGGTCETCTIRKTKYFAQFNPGCSKWFHKNWRHSGQLKNFNFNNITFSLSNHAALAMEMRAKEGYKTTFVPQVVIESAGEAMFRYIKQFFM